MSKPPVVDQKKLLKEIADARTVVEESKRRMVELKVLIATKERYIYECVDKLREGAG